MTFRGTNVWVKTDEKGHPIVSGGRVEMRYKEDGGKVYRGSASGLSEAATPVPAASRSRVSFDVPPKLVPVSAAGKRVLAYADGACSGNPGKAGLGVYGRIDEREFEYQEPLGDSTNNVAELMAILRTLQMMSGAPQVLLLRTDSRYAIGVLTEPWKPKKNQALILRCKQAMEGVNVRFEHVAGHAGEPGNERADQLARMALDLDGPRQTETSRKSASP